MAVLELLATSAWTRIVGPGHLLADDRHAALGLSTLTRVLHSSAAPCLLYLVEVGFLLIVPLLMLFGSSLLHGLLLHWDLTAHEE